MPPPCLSHFRLPMQLFVPKETVPGESRVALVPTDAASLVALGIAVFVESGLGAESDYPDEAFQRAGANVVPDRTASLQSSDIVLRVLKPDRDEVDIMKNGALHISFLDPFNEAELIDRFKRAGASVISMEMMPRSSIAQKMDSLSSQANLAGYYAVIKAAESMKKVIPMMMTPAGTISPSRFFIVGVGMAGLQAIATAKRLGARVEAFDTRPEVEEQVKSLGAKFIRIELGETGQTKQGYARELTPEQLDKQRTEIARICAYSDVVITTAKLFGKKAPLIINREMLAQMQLGSIVVDLAVESGGNVEGSRIDEEVVTENGVHILGMANLEGGVSHHASQVYSSNLTSLIQHFWSEEERIFRFDLDDEILKSCLLTHRGEIIHPSFQ